MEHGRILERGSHAELLALDGRYAEMWALQQASADDTDDEPADPSDPSFNFQLERP
jgi:ATP-binding cassette subfamily B protein